MKVKRLTKCLNDLKNGAQGAVLRVNATGRVGQRLAEMGVTPGVRVRVTRRAPLCDPLELELRGYTLTLRAEDARKILVSEDA